MQDLIAARIDRLDDGPKELLQTASVIGREFSHRLLVELAHERARRGPPARSRGQRADSTPAPIPSSGRTSSTTRSPRTSPTARCSARDAARSTARIAEAIEALAAERLAEHYEVLAHHFFEGESWEKALDYLLKGAAEGRRGVRFARGAGAVRAGLGSSPRDWAMPRPPPRGSRSTAPAATSSTESASTRARGPRPTRCSQLARAADNRALEASRAGPRRVRGRLDGRFRRRCGRGGRGHPARPRRPASLRRSEEGS